MPKAIYSDTKGLYQEAGSGFQVSHMSSMPNGAAATFADLDLTIPFSASDTGKASLSNVATENTIITLPAGAPIGTNFIHQSLDILLLKNFQIYLSSYTYFVL